MLNDILSFEANKFPRILNIGIFLNAIMENRKSVGKISDDILKIEKKYSKNYQAAPR
jgi:hypothetical protein